MTNKLNNQHVNNEKNEVSPVVTHKGKYINNVNCSNFFLSEFEEMKSCK